jgi:hypothetical protein
MYIVSKWDKKGKSHLASLNNKTAFEKIFAGE